MTESLHNQISAAEAMLRESEDRIAALHTVRERVRELVGHAEYDEGKIVVEWSSGDGLTRLDLDPKVMRMPSADLAEALKQTVRDAVADLSRQSREVIAEAGPLASATPPSPEELRDRLAGAREKFLAAGRDAADGLSRARQRMDPSGGA